MSWGRRKFPDRRSGHSVELRWGEEHHKKHVFVVTYSFWSMLPHHVLGDVGEIFLSDPKPTSQLGAAARDALKIASYALQHGATLQALVDGLPQDHEGKPESIAAAALRLALHDSEIVKREWARAYFVAGCGER